MIRSVVLFLFLSPAAFGQFSSMVTTEDGSVLYFVTTLKQKGTEQPNWGKVFRADASGVHLYSVIEKSTSNPFLSNYYNLAEVDVSGDGRLVARSATQDCLLGFYLCQGFGGFLGVIDGAPVANRSFGGDIRLSANGKFGLLDSKGTLRVVNTATGAVLEPAVQLPGAGLAVSPNRLIAGDELSDTAPFSAVSGPKLWGPDHSIYLLCPWDRACLPPSSTRQRPNLFI